MLIANPTSFYGPGPFIPEATIQIRQSTWLKKSVPNVGRKKEIGLFVKNVTCKGGRKSYCKVCDTLATKARQRRYKSGEVRIDRKSKTCPQCGKHKHIDDFPKNRYSIDGHHGCCKMCNGKMCKKARNEREPVLNPTIDFNICSKCKVEKSAGEFYPNYKASTGLSSQCKICHGITVKVTTDPGKKKEWGHNRWVEDKDKILAYQRERRRKNPERDRAYDRGYRAKTRVKRRKQMVVAVSKRRARKLSYPDTFTVAEADILLEHFDQKCAFCGSDKDIVFDHMIPLSRDDISNHPGTTLENMLPLCKWCNGSKQAKTLKEYLSNTSYWYSPGLREKGETMTGEEIYNTIIDHHQKLVASKTINN